MATGKAPRADVYEAVDTFIYRGDVIVNRGATVEAGHPMLKGREKLFRPFSPTFTLAGAQPEAPRGNPEPEPQGEPEPEPA